MADEPPLPAADFEDLLAAALAKFDEGGQAALDAFVRAHPAQATALERGIRRCRRMGLLGHSAATADHPDRLGEFRLLRRIGGGGMGVVYEAMQEPLGRRVALKVIRPELLYFEGARERFRREVDAIAKLDHPAIVSVFAAGEHEGVPFFTMDLIDGVTIEQACANLRDRKPDELRGEDLRAMLASEHATGALFLGSWWETAVRIGHQVALGLRHAHLRGIVHRDIKPSNVMVTPHGQAIVLDFGVAKVHAARELTRSGAAPGSPAFMSPEQRRGQATDERTDVYSLAATVWHLLTLQLPFGRDVVHAHEDLPALRSLLRGAPPELDLVLRTAMDPDRDHRYGDIAAFAADLQAVLDRRPIEARPLGLGLRALRWCQRHRAAAAAIAVAGVAAAVMLVVFAIVQRSSQQALLAEQQLTRQSLDSTLELLHTSVGRLANDELLAMPQAEEVAHGVMLDAVKQYRALLQAHPHDEQVRAQGGWALHSLAMSFARQGDQANAMATVREAIAVFDAEQPIPALRRYRRGDAWTTLAEVAAAGGDQATTRDAIEHAERDFAESSQEPAWRARSLRSRGELCSRRMLLHEVRDDPATAEQVLRDAIALQRESMALGVPNARDPSVLAWSVHTLGKFLMFHRRPDEALVVLEEALSLARALPARGWPPTSVFVAEVHAALGETLAQLGETDADAHFRESVAGWQTAVEQFPSTVEFRVKLAGTLHNFGIQLHRRGDRLGEALATFEQARTLQQQALAKSPHDVMALEFLSKHLEMIGVCQAALGNADQVAEAARALSVLDSRDPRVAVRAAVCHLRAFECRGRVDVRDLDAAMADLLAAEQRGLTAAQLPSQGLETLQERPDFRALKDRLGR